MLYHHRGMDIGLVLRMGDFDVAGNDERVDGVFARLAKVAGSGSPGASSSSPSSGTRTRFSASAMSR
eukprot:295481-Alexandrium_andersonii.AAC.1